MIKHTQIILRQLPTNCLSMFDQFVGLALKGIAYFSKISKSWSLHFFYMRPEIISKLWETLQTNLF